MKIGLIGLPKSGKTTLFNLLTGAQVATARYDAGRAELHTGVARVPDPRVDRLSALFMPKKTTYASFEVVDLAGIAKGERTGLETKEFRNADALLHVVRAFTDEVSGPADPKRDIVDLETELILADLDVVERRLERLEVSIKRQRKEAEVREQAILRGLKAALEAETPLRAVNLTLEDAKEFRNADALLHVVRAFSDAAGTAPDPTGDIADLETELILADLEVVERRLERLEASIKKKRTDGDVKEQAILLRLKPALESETPIRAADLSDDDARAIRGFTFLSQKPILHCLNL